MNRLDHAFNFCPRCATELEIRDERGTPRPSCPACGFVQYQNPAPAAAAIIFRGDRLCLVRRRFAPKAGQWTLPAGFVEFDEDVAATVVREVREETGLVVRPVALFDVLTGILPPHHPVVLVFYRVEELGGELAAGDDADEVGFYDLDGLPGEIAFASHRTVLSRLREERR